MLSQNAKRLLFFLFFSFLLSALFFRVYSPLLTPIGISLFLCFLLSPLVNKLETFKIPRTFSSLFLVVTTLVIITIIMIIALPYAYNELRSLISMIPKALQIVEEKWIPALREFLITARVTDGLSFDKMMSQIGDFSQISNKAYATLNTVLHTIPKLIGTMVNLILIPMITFFALVNMPKIKENLLTLVPFDLRGPTTEIFSKLSHTIRSLLKGQALVAFFVGILYCLAFSLIGLQSAIAIGIITGVGRLIPYVDMILGGSLSLLVVFSNFEGWTDLIPVAIAFFVVGSLDGMLIAPKILGKHAGLHPVVVILSLLSFASLYGFWGFVLAIPAIAIFKDILFFTLPYYYRSEFYKKVKK